LNDLYLVNELNFQLNNKSFDHLESISKIYFNESIILLNDSIYVCFFINSIARVIQRNVSNKYIFYKSLNFITPMSTSLVNPTNKKNWCEIVFHFLQFKIHLNILTDEEFELYFKNCQEYLTGKINGYNHFQKKCLNEFDLVENENEQLNETNKSQIYSDFLFLIIIMFLILVVSLPLFFICQKSFNGKPLSSKKINHEISSIALNDNHDNQSNDQLSLALVETSTLKISSELPEAI
jgi:hypothetical protein